MDFTFNIYTELLSELMRQDYTFQTFEEFITNPNDRVVILRHDVDKRPNHSLKFAQIQNDYGEKNIYPFRCSM